MQEVRMAVVSSSTVDTRKHGDVSHKIIITRSARH